MPKRTPSRTPSRWNGLSPEERRRERRQLLIAAAFDLLATEGTAGTTVRAVCSSARLNPRYFYESFEELDELVVAVYDHVIDRMRHEVVTAVESAGDDPVEEVRAVVTALVTFIDGDRRLGRVLYVEALGNEALNARRLKTGFDLVDILQRDVERRRGTKGAQQLERLAAAMLVGGSSEVLAAWLDGRIDMTADELIEDLTQLFLAVGSRTAKLASARSPAKATSGS